MVDVGIREAPVTSVIVAVHAVVMRRSGIALRVVRVAGGPLSPIGFVLIQGLLLSTRVDYHVGGGTWRWGCSLLNPTDGRGREHVLLAVSLV